MSKVNRVHVAFVLDRSASMSMIGQESIDGFNERLKEIKEKNNDTPTSVSLVTFSTGVDNPIMWEVPAEDVEELTPDQYKPAGMTAMLDAVGTTIDALKALPDAEDDDVAFLVVVISDGQENNSKEYSSQKIAAMVNECEESGSWTFAYLGANQDLAKVSQDTGIDIGNTMAFAATGQGVRMRGQAETSMLDSAYASYSAGIRSVKKGLFSSNTNNADGDNLDTGLDLNSPDK